MVPDPASVSNLIYETLGDRYIKLVVGGVTIKDDTRGSCEVELIVNDNLLFGSGIGMVDATFDAIKTYYLNEYRSLETIKLSNFKISLSKNKNKTPVSGISGTDSLCSAHLTLKNSYGTSFEFNYTSCSLMASVACSIALGVQHFINSERAYIALQTALEDAKKRNRIDLVTKYTNSLSMVVQSTSYTGIIKDK